MPERQAFEAGAGGSSLVYGPIVITDPTLGCPITVAAGPVRGAKPPRFASGWGNTIQEAATACGYEADETYFAQMIPHERLSHARAGELRGHVIEPPALTLFSDAQYGERMHWNENVDDSRAVPIRWRRSQPLDWIRSDPRFSTSEAWLPAGLCFLGFPNDESSGLPPADSNGLARGSSIEDAVVRGFLEVVERDATAIWWYHQLVLPLIDLTSLADGLASQYADWLQTQSRELRLLNLKLDLPIPVVAAISHDVGGRAMAFGLAAGRSTSEAARRAVGELAECEANLALLKRTAVLSGTAGFTMGALQLYRWHLEVDIHQYPHLLGGATVPASPDELRLDWCSCLDTCRKRDLELLVVDLTRDRKSPVARVFVPGLRHTKPRFAAGRLYDVPVRMGLKPSLSQPSFETLFPL
ncbi:YcaO-like family protein [Allomesorhizobium alhagi]|uniref:YcaO domain-containing protein n=1 Tax=Mesorhizobium alhagi CCNWXJ12-2 TaxID=1107882 RepID=H0I088_9HYPH|nr:YcaO-like family protein [Mesorhizobium alhagi]EHK53634.1 hypothetical protein MAXJ12_29375 [Mesorhizobium alhagi CCNWXJ12-2]